MKLPAVRFKITPKEYTMLRPGLDMLANRLATAQMGSFPFRHPWDRIDLVRSDVHRHRAFAADMAERILNVRRKMSNLSETRKIRLDALDLAAAIFALRVCQPKSKGFSETEGAEPLARKLEILRRRARRAAESKVGQDEFALLANTWRHFVSWCRYNLLYFNAARHAANPTSLRPFLKNHWAEQRSKLERMIVAALEQKCYAPLSSGQLERMVRLLKESFRRGRHPVTLRELLAKPDDANLDMLFWLVFRKLELTPLEGAEVPLCVVSSARTEKFEEAKQRRQASNRLDPSAPTSDIAAVSIPDPSADGLLGTLRPLSNQELVDAVAIWFEMYVDRKHWEAVGNFAYKETMTRPPSRVNVPSAKTLAELMLKARPKELSSATPAHSAPIAYLSEWLLCWMYRFRDLHLDVANILFAGCTAVFRRNPITQAA